MKIPRERLRDIRACVTNESYELGPQDRDDLFHALAELIELRWTEDHPRRAAAMKQRSQGKK